MADVTKTCSRCREEKPKEDFWGTANYCKPCYNAYRRDLRKRKKRAAKKNKTVAEQAMERLVCTVCNRTGQQVTFRHWRANRCQICTDARQHRCPAHGIYTGGYQCTQCQTDARRKRLNANHDQALQLALKSIRTRQGMLCHKCGKMHKVSYRCP